MKSRSSSPPILVHANESTPVRVHIQKPKLLPSVVEKGPTRRVSITLGGTENNSSVIHSSDASFDEKSNINKQVYRCGLQIDSLMEDLESLKNKLSCKLLTGIVQLSGHLTNEQFEDGLSTSNWTTEECEAETQELNRTTDKIRTFKESFEKLQKELDLRGLEKEDLGEENMLLTALKEAEMASISTAEQVAALKNSTVELIQDARRGRPEVEDQKLEHRCRNQVAEVNQLSASGVGRFAGANNLLLEKLENFKIANQKLQYLLRDLWNPEPCVNCTNRQMGVLTQKLTRSETENIHLKRKLLDIERNAKEFSEQYQMEKDNSCFVKQLSKSVEATQVRLQEQLKNKDAKSNRMSIQIRDLKLSETRLTVDSWKKQHDLAVEEKAQLETEIISLSNRVADLKEQLQSSAERSRSTSHDLLSKLHNSNLENSNLRLENAQLKVSLTALEEKASTATAEIEQLKAEGKQQKEVVLQYETQAGDQSFQLKSSSEKVESLHEEKQKLQTALEALSRRLKEVDLQNQELTETMAKQEEALLHSRCQLEERSRESAALSRQLEAAIHDVSEKVSEVKDQAVAQECALQSKVHSLESELNRKTKELKQLQQNKNNAEMSHKTHLQELKLSLEQSESENQSIQNYVQFLKMSYAIMFGDSTLTEFHAEPSLR
ncbi:outer dense fiber protein 2-like isoform X4 [Carcharodon carcharias]|uniref:outer dense fiber protein 2-like isoform X4 n=1 Tax=Carcharodon carcharias TaxID=13397 RepID=UPI001B7F4415|nr:outer dense fiber protein 2-like isoform X4 [Carcharodon carcharias]